MQCMDRAVLEKMLGGGLSLAELGARMGRHESTVAYWLSRYGLEASGRRRHAAKGGLTRAQLAPLIEEEMSISQIAEALDRSNATVRHWLKAQGDPRGRGRWQVRHLRLQPLCRGAGAVLAE